MKDTEWNACVHCQSVGFCAAQMTLTRISSSAMVGTGTSLTADCPFLIVTNAFIVFGIASLDILRYSSSACAASAKDDGRQKYQDDCVSLARLENAGYKCLLLSTSAATSSASYEEHDSIGKEHESRYDGPGLIVERRPAPCVMQFRVRASRPDSDAESLNANVQRVQMTIAYQQQALCVSDRAHHSDSDGAY